NLRARAGKRDVQVARLGVDHVLVPCHVMFKRITYCRLPLKWLANLDRKIPVALAVIEVDARNMMPRTQIDHSRNRIMLRRPVARPERDRLAALSCRRIAG